MCIERNAIICKARIQTGNESWILLEGCNGLFRLMKDSHKVRLETCFELYSMLETGLCLSAIKAKDEILCISSKSDYLTIYSLKEKEKTIIALEEVNGSYREVYDSNYKFYNGCPTEDGALIFPGTYPSFIKWERDTKKIYYITNWLKEVENSIHNGDKHCYLGDGMVRIGRKVYLPMNCCDIILILNLDSLQFEFKKLNCIMDGYEGIAYWKSTIYLIGRYGDAYYLIIWTLISDKVDKIKIPYTGDSIFWVSFFRPVYYKQMVYLIPVIADHFYRVNLQKKTIDIFYDVELLLKGYNFKSKTPKVSYFDFNDGLLIFQTYYDYIWHEYNLDTCEYTEYKIMLDDEKYWQLYRKDLCMEMLKKEKFISEKDISLKAYLGVIKANNGE